MAGDGGFERDFVNNLNESSDENHPQYLCYRRKQSRFASQDIDLLVDSRDPTFYSGLECKSKKIDTDKTQKDNNQTEGKLYFSNSFNTNVDGKHQIDHITDWLNRTGRKGALVIAYRRGRGRKVHYYALAWKNVWDMYQDEDKTGITKGDVEEYGIPLHEADTPDELRDKKRSEKETKFDKVFQVISESGKQLGS